MSHSNALLRKIPSVETMLNHPDMQPLMKSHTREFLTTIIRESIDTLRTDIISGNSFIVDDLERSVVELASASIARFKRPFYRKSVNATGIILHTGLGRAVLPQVAIEQIQRELGGYSVLQLDIEAGKRSQRDIAVEKLLCDLTGAEAATVVNNNAAATAIVLNTIGNGREVIVSRGQLVEIGGSYRLPDVMRFSGAKMVEVGTTNKTHPKDYVNAITDDTAALMRVHPSNYKITGFSSEVDLQTMVDITHRYNLVMIDDVGAGSLIDFSKYGFDPEPTLLDSVRMGADIITSSGDKLIGASQAGIILGKKKYIDAIRKNQFARIVRVDKVTLATLEATLKLFFDEKTAFEHVPTLKMLNRNIDELTAKANDLCDQIKQKTPLLEVLVLDGFSQMGSGSLPQQNLKTKLVGLKSPTMNCEELAQRLRQYDTPIFTRIQHDTVLIDPRTLLEGDDRVICEALLSIVHV